MIAIYIDANFSVHRNPDAAFEAIRVLQVDDRLGQCRDRLEAMILMEAERDCRAQYEGKVAKDWTEANLHVVPDADGDAGYVMLFGMTIGYYQLRSV